MIGSLTGRIASKSPPQVVVEVGGVGYELQAPMSTFFLLPDVGAQVRLLTHMVVREDAHVLYGFGSESERRLFRSLLKVSGVGPKMALALLSGLSVEDFEDCVRREDATVLVRVPGVGRKTAERLIVELRDRFDQLPGDAVAGGPTPTATPANEAFDALVALGYKAAEATRLLKSAAPGAQSTEELIRRALKGAVRD